MSSPRVRVFLAISMDGFIAGPDDDLSWLPGDDPADDAEASDDPDALRYDAFIEGVGALLMGRRTYDVVRGFGVPWPYGDRPVLVATTRPLDEDPPATVRPVRGGIAELVEQALSAAGGKDVYLDGGVLIRQAVEGDLVDDFTISVAPVAIGSGLPLFAGIERPYRLEILSHHRVSPGMLQIRARPMRG